MRTLFTLSMLTSLIGCGGTLDASKKALASAEAFVEKSALAFEAYDRKTQSDIAHDPALKTTATGEALKAYRQKRQPVIDAFHTVDKAIVAADSILPLVEAGMQPDKNLTILISQAIGALQKLQEAFKALGFTPSILSDFPR